MIQLLAKHEGRLHVESSNGAFSVTLSLPNIRIIHDGDASAAVNPNAEAPGSFARGAMFGGVVDRLVDAFTGVFARREESEDGAGKVVVDDPGFEDCAGAAEASQVGGEECAQDNAGAGHEDLDAARAADEALLASSAPATPGSVEVRVTDHPRFTPEHYLPQAVDEGQHDFWKRDAALILWREINGQTAAGAVVDVAALGLSSDTQPRVMQAAYPLQPDFAAACRRLGFRRLFFAAAGEMGGEGGQLRTLVEQSPIARLPKACDEGGYREELLDVIEGIHMHAVRAAEAEADAILDRNRESRARLEAQGAGHQLGPQPTRDEALLQHHPGAFSRPDLVTCPPLAPYDFILSEA